MHFGERGVRRVLDVGCGPGKFCVAAALSRPDLNFCGVDRSVDLTITATAVAATLRASNTEFRAGDALDAPWHDFDGFYFFNPFAEDAPSTSVKGDSSRAGTHLLRVAELLGEAARGATVVTYHGLGGPIPSTYDLAAEEPVGSGALRVWVKNRTREAAWYHLDYSNDVSRIPRKYLQRQLRAQKPSAETSSG
jgi:SAM-dependent methyltransferase